MQDGAAPHRIPNQTRHSNKPDQPSQPVSAPFPLLLPPPQPPSCHCSQCRHVRGSVSSLRQVRKYTSLETEGMGDFKFQLTNVFMPSPSCSTNFDIKIDPSPHLDSFPETLAVRVNNVLLIPYVNSCFRRRLWKPNFPETLNILISHPFSFIIAIITILVTVVIIVIIRLVLERNIFSQEKHHHLLLSMTSIKFSRPCPVFP